MAVGHLTSLGHRAIACIAGPQDVSTGLSRYRGFQAAMAGARLEVPPGRVAFASAFTIEEGYRCAKEILAAGGGCTAVAAGNDMLAVGCYLALDEAGLSCPADMSVVGFNDMPFISMLRPPLTTVVVLPLPGRDRGGPAPDRAAERHRRGQGALPGARADRARLHGTPELIVRGSTARAS